MPEKPASAPGLVTSAVPHAPEQGRKSFLFGGACLVEQRDSALTITLEPGALFLRGESLVDGAPTSTAEAIAPTEIVITCAGTAHVRHDSVDWPSRPRWKGGARVVFRGGVAFSRLLLDEGPVLLVQAAVRAVEGLPRGVSLEAWETVRFEVVAGGHEGGPGGGDDCRHGGQGGRPDCGPHHPFP